MNHTVFISGASSGIGMELAWIFAKNNFNLILVARSADKLLDLSEKIRQQYNVRVAAFARDLSDLYQVKELYELIQKEGVFVDFVVNNAGFGDFGFFTETNWQKEQLMIQLNITSLTYITKLFLQDMKREGKGRIMNVASTAAFQPGPLMAVYYATKAYVLHFSEALSNELKDTHITVTALCPGPTASNFQQVAALTESKLVKYRNIPTAAQVANYAFEAMTQGKKVAIHGIKNRIQTFLIRFLPRAWVAHIVRKMQEVKPTS